MSNADRRISRHTLLDGTPRTYRADLPPYTGPIDGNLIIGNGMEVIVEACFHTWNGIEGLDMLYVLCPATGKRTHVTPADIGWTEPLVSVPVMVRGVQVTPDYAGSHLGVE